jgi:hypothetical protein
MKASSARQSEWTILRTSPVNGLLVGSPDLTAAAVAEMGKSLRQPLMWWSPDQGIDLPNLTTGTLAIRDVDDLDARQQEQLVRWIALHAPGVRVLALAREPLFESVTHGRFSAALYYRLNTVVVEVRAAADLP